MNYQINHADEHVNISLHGKLTFSANESFRTIINTCSHPAPKTVIMDLASLDFIDSTGLGMLLVAHDHVKKSGGRMEVRNPNGQVSRMLGLARFTDFFAIN